MVISRTGPSRRSDVAPFYAMDVMSLAEREAARRAESGDVVVRLEVGQPSGPAPKTSRDAVRAALETPLGYTPALGLQALRERIARHYHETYNVEIDPARVIVTSGSSAGFQLAFLTLFDAGDRLAMADPGYPSYRNIAQALDIVPTRLEAFRDSGFQPTPELWAEARRAHGRLAGLLTASPANPTGAMLNRSALTNLIEATAADGAAFISDEIYHGLHYGDRAVSALEIAEPLGVETFVINSFSKYYAMTGWRIGWMIVPERLARPVERLAQNLFICPPHISQVAALAAFEGVAELEERRLAYAENRALLLEALPSLGFEDIAPCDGAFYIYAGLGGLVRGSADPAGESAAWCRRLLVEGGVAAAPGIDFDPLRGAKTVRFSFARSAGEIRLGVERLRRHLAG